MSTLPPLAEGLEHHAAGRFAAAEAVYRARLAGGDDQPTLAAYAALALAVAQPAAGLELADRALALKPDDAATLANRALARHRQSDLHGAARDYYSALALDPGPRGAWAGLGDIRLSLGHDPRTCFDRAPDDFRSAAGRQAWADRATPSLPAPPFPPLPPVPRLADADLAGARKILVLKLDEIGDFVLATPFLRGLRRAAPNAEITLLVTPTVYPLARGCPFADRIAAAAISPEGDGQISQADDRTIAAIIKDWGQGAFDLAIVARYDYDRYGAGALAAQSKARLVVGFDEHTTEPRRRSNRGFDANYTHTLHWPHLAHEIEQNGVLLAHLGGVPDLGPTALWPNAAERSRAALLLAPLGGRPFLAVCPGGAYPLKRFPVTRLGAIADRVARAHGLGIVLIGGADAQAMASAFQAALSHPAINLAGRLSLPESAAALGAARVVLSNDSGPAHIAAALGAPVAVLFAHPATGSPSHIHEPRRFRPWAPPDRLIVLQPPTAWGPCRDSCEAPIAHCVSLITDAAIETALARLIG